MCRKKARNIFRGAPVPNRGFSLIELMLTAGAMAIIAAVALPVHSNFTIRSKIDEALSLGNAVKQAVSAACLESDDQSIPDLKGSQAFRELMELARRQAHVDRIEVGGACSDPIISITVGDTGISPDPVVTLTGKASADKLFVYWRCYSTSPNYILPATCRS